jgi:hypothetical protein
MTQTPIDKRRRMAQISPMRTLPLVVLAALALTGCMSRDSAWEKAYNEKRALALQNGQEPARQPVQMAPRPQMARSEPQMVSGGPVYVPVPVVIDTAPTAPPQPAAIQPIIVTGAGGGTAIATQVGGSTIVSQMGAGRSGTTIVTESDFGTVVSRFGGAGSGTTIATQSSYGTVVSQIGGNRGLYLPPAPPIYTGNQTPTVYTMPVSQP